VEATPTQATSCAGVTPVVAPGCVLLPPSGGCGRTLSSGGNSGAATQMRESRFTPIVTSETSRVSFGRHGRILSLESFASAVTNLCGSQSFVSATYLLRLSRGPRPGVSQRRQSSNAVSGSGTPRGDPTAVQSGAVERCTAFGLYQFIRQIQSALPAERAGGRRGLCGCLRPRRKHVDSDGPAVQSLSLRSVLYVVPGL
jgi:hypothetical protein